MRKGKRQIVGKKIFGIAAALAMVFLLAFAFRGSITRAFAVVQRPLVQAGTWITNKTSINFPSSEFTKKIEDLELQRNNLSIDYAELKQLKDENAQLREQLGFVSRQSYSYVSAAIISRTSSNFSATFTIDRGSKDGIKEGSPVIVGEGFLIGKVTRVEKTTSIVTATTDTGMAFAATLLNEGRTIGIAEGSTGRLIKLSFIPHAEQIEVNNLVVTSGLEDRIPSGLLIGIVNEVTSDSTLPFQEATIEPLVDIERQRIVSVLLRDDL